MTHSFKAPLDKFLEIPLGMGDFLNLEWVAKSGIFIRFNR